MKKLKIPLYQDPWSHLELLKKLSIYLVRGKLYPLERTVGSWKCIKKRCKVCKNVQNSDTL